MNTAKILGWADVRNVTGWESVRWFSSRSKARKGALGKVTKVKMEKPDDKHLVAKAWGIFDRGDNTMIDLYVNRSAARTDYSGSKSYRIKPVFLDSSK